MSDNALTDEVKTFIVQALACWDTPSAVASAVKAEFGIVVERSHVQHYDPTKAAGADLSNKWRELFFATREAFTAETVSIGIAYRAVRLRRLERLIDKAEKQGATALAAQLLVQAAKETGDVYTNRQKIDATHGFSHEQALDALDGAGHDSAGAGASDPPAR